MRTRVCALIFVVIACCVIIDTEKQAMAIEKDRIQLPQPDTKGSVSLEQAISKRRSPHSFAQKELSLEQISQLLWAAQGITGSKHGFSFRAAPSAGALYPMEIYLLSKNGLFHYIPQGHILEIKDKKDLRKALADSAFGQHVAADASIDIVICAVYSRVTSKYKEHGTRYVHIEAGHIAQNIHLQAVALGLGSVPVGAFDDDGVKKALSLPADNEPLYIIPVGYPQD